MFSLVDIVISGGENIFLIYSEQSVDFNRCSRGNILQLKYLAEEDYVLYSKGTELRILRYEQCLDKRCGITGFE